MFIRVSAIAVAVVIGVMNPAHAASTLDQGIAYPGNDCNTEVYSAVGLGQSFTAGLSGSLTSVELYLVDVAPVGSEPGLTVELKSASSDLPTGSVLATATIPDSDVPSSPGLVTVTFSSPATLTAGQQYAILVTTTEGSGNYRWGVYEIYGDDGSLKSVFIPAGYSMHITAAPRVFAIWSNAAAPAVGGQVPE